MNIEMITHLEDDDMDQGINKEHKGSVLVVDDEEGMRFTLNHYLTQAGYRVRQAADIAEAVLIVAEERFDAAIIDRVLSNGRNGLHLSRIMREIMPSCKTILVSAWPTVDSAIQAMRYQVFGYLSKPIRKDDLLAIIEQALRTDIREQKHAFGK
ncbi:MAG: response regulator [Thermodesulfobacteriota bacterium]